MSQSVLASETHRGHLQQIISGLSDGVILTDTDQTLLWANEAALAMHGVSHQKALGPMPASTRRVLPCAIATIIRWFWNSTR
ncbi:PAS domain-containing protein [Serratia marcescens]